MSSRIVDTLSSSGGRREGRESVSDDRRPLRAGRPDEVSPHLGKERWANIFFLIFLVDLCKLLPGKGKTVVEKWLLG